MSSIKVIDGKNLPARFPISQMIAMYLLLQHFGAPGWAYGIIFTIYALVCILIVIVMCKQHSIDIFKD